MARVDGYKGQDGWCKWRKDQLGSTHTLAAYTAGTASSEMSSVAFRKAKACPYVVTAGNMLDTRYIVNWAVGRSRTHGSRVLKFSAIAVIPDNFQRTPELFLLKLRGVG